MNKLSIDPHNLIKYTKFKTVLLERLRLVNITSDDGDNPYLIFESLNYKGQALTQADLVRNYIFMKLPNDRREEIYKHQWLPLQKHLKNNMKEEEYAEELTKAFWFYLRKEGKKVGQKEVYQAIKKHIDTSNNNVEYELKELVRFTNYYQRMNFENVETEPSLCNRFKRLVRLKFNTCHIFLLNIYHEYDNKRLSLEDFEKILLYLESYFVRRLFAGISTQTLGSIFNNLYKEVIHIENKNLVEALYTVLDNHKGNKIWPKDDEFRQGIITKNVYSSNDRDRVKFVLESLEESLNSKEKVNTKSLEIEHVMPQSLSREWQGLLGHNSDNIHKQWVHTLGNLTLTGYNSGMSNKVFNEKKTIYSKSNISLNKYFSNVEHWNETEIKIRAEKLADIAIRVWPR